MCNISDSIIVFILIVLGLGKLLVQQADPERPALLDLQIEKVISSLASHYVEVAVEDEHLRQ